MHRVCVKVFGVLTFYTYSHAVFLLSFSVYHIFFCLSRCDFGGEIAKFS